MASDVFYGRRDRINARELREQREERGVLATKPGGGGYRLGKKEPRNERCGTPAEASRLLTFKYGRSTQFFRDQVAVSALPGNKGHRIKPALASGADRGCCENRQRPGGYRVR